MNKFKVGDKVRSTTNKHYSNTDRIEKDKNYYVKELVGKVSVCVSNGDPSMSWPSSLFKKVPSNGKSS